MKWACLALPVIDLLLVAAAGFRLMTVPPAEVNKFEDSMVDAVGEFAEAAQAEVERMASEETSGSDSSEDYDLNPDAPAEYDEDGGNYLSDDEYKNIELSEEGLAEYDDQETKGKRLNEAKGLIRARFGTD